MTSTVTSNHSTATQFSGRPKTHQGSSKTTKMDEALIDRKIDSFENFTRVDDPEDQRTGVRQHVPVTMPKGNHTIVVTNPHGTGFMAKAGMHAILVKFQEHQGNLNLEPGKLYSLALKDDGIGEIEMLYFTTQPEGQEGEMILLKWNEKDRLLQPVTTVMRGMDLDKGAYKIDQGHTWQVEAIYQIRSEARRGKVIEEIRNDIKFLEKLKRARTSRARKVNAKNARNARKVAKAAITVQ